MAQHIKTGEAWFGDSFDRSISLGPGELSITANNCSINTDALSALTGYCDKYTVASADCSIATNCTGYAVAKGIQVDDNISIISSVDTLSNKLNELSARIDDLKQNFVPKKGANKLRSALKTLQYKREVE